MAAGALRGVAVSAQAGQFARPFRRERQRPAPAGQALRFQHDDRRAVAHEQGAAPRPAENALLACGLAQHDHAHAGHVMRRAACQDGAKVIHRAGMKKTARQMGRLHGETQ